LPPPIPEWIEYRTEDGTPYYFDQATNTTTWDRPEQFQGYQSGLERPPPPPMGSESTREVLADKEKVQFFKKFLEDEGANSELLFFMDLEHFEARVKNRPKLTQDDLYVAESIYVKYMKKGAPFHVPLSHKLKKQISQAYKAATKTRNPALISPSLFKEAQQEVVALLEQGQFPRFMKSMMYINMYNSMMLGSTKFVLPDLLWEELVIAAEGGVEEGWEFAAETKGVLIHTKAYKNEPGISVRGSGVLPIPPEEMRVLCTSLSLREQWDPLYQGGGIIEQLDDKTILCRYAFRPPTWAKMIFKPMDFVVLRTERVTADGTVLVLARSVVHKDAPEIKGITRSEIQITGFVIKPCGATSSVVIYVSQAEMKGIPKNLEKKYMHGRVLMIRKMRKFIEKELKEKKREPAWKQDFAQQTIYDSQLTKKSPKSPKVKH